MAGESGFIIVSGTAGVGWAVVDPVRPEMIRKPPKLCGGLPSA